jgi:hypothetical protein
VAFLALGDVTLGELQVVEDALGVGPLSEQIVVLEEVVVAESGVRHHQGLHGHGAFFHVVADAGVRINHDLIGQPHVALAVHLAFPHESLAEGPVLIHERHADGRICSEAMISIWFG